MDKIIIEQGINLKKVYSAGFVVFKTIGDRKHQFLLLKKFNTQLDLPKGHLDLGETTMQAAIRELKEETGIMNNYIVDDEFIFEDVYYTKYKRFIF